MTKNDFDKIALAACGTNASEDLLKSISTAIELGYCMGRKEALVECNDMAKSLVYDLNQGTN